MRRVKVNVTEPYEGYFHCFSSDYGIDRIAYPVAIVEKDDGTVTAVDIDLIQFVKELDHPHIGYECGHCSEHTILRLPNEPLPKGY